MNVMKKLFKGVRAHPTKRTWFAVIPLVGRSFSTPNRDTQEEAARDYDNVVFYCSEWLTCRRAFNFPSEWEDTAEMPPMNDVTQKIHDKIKDLIASKAVDKTAWDQAADRQRWRDRQRDGREFSARLLRALLNPDCSFETLAELKQQWEELVFEIERHAV